MPFVFDVYDKDYGHFETDDFLGRAVIPLSETSFVEGSDTVLPTPKWH